MKLKLNNLENSRKSLARVLRDYANDEMEEKKARTMSYLFSAFLQYWKLEADLDIEERLAAIEQHFTQQGTFK